MAQPNGSFIRGEDAVGTQLASVTVNGKKFGVVMLAGPSGHIEGSLDSWLLSIPPQVLGANKLHFDFFNADAAKIIKVRGIWVIVAQDVANAAVVSARLDWFRTSAIGTAGTAAAAGSNTIAPTFAPKDTTNAALPTGITARAAPTGGAASDDWLFPTFHATEELQVGGALSQWNNILPDPDRGEQELVLRQNQGLKAVQGAVAGAGNIGFLVSFTAE